MPALAAAVVVGGSVVAAGAVGTRRVGTDIPVPWMTVSHWIMYQSDDGNARRDFC